MEVPLHLLDGRFHSYWMLFFGKWQNLEFYLVLYRWEVFPTFRSVILFLMVFLVILVSRVFMVPLLI